MQIMAGIEYYIFYYPLAMGIAWAIGALYFFLRRERGTGRLPVTGNKLVSVIIPARNEADAIKSTVASVLKSDYPCLEVVAVDDCSTDQTGILLEKMAAADPRLRVLHLEQSMGKPYALRCGFLASNSDILVTLDARVDPAAISWLVSHFASPRVGAVMGNPRVRNRTSLPAKIQVGEYSSIMGMIKRTRQLVGKGLTVPGAVVAFRREALFDAGLWDAAMITDDVNITWELEKRFWVVRYEPRALYWIQVPDTFKDLWRQRTRWAQGGGEVIRRHRDVWQSWKQRRLWPVYLEYVMLVCWSYAYVGFNAAWLVNWVMPLGLQGIQFIPEWHGSFFMLACLLQFAVALVIDRRDEQSTTRYLFWVIWYPFLYWLLIALTTVWATTKALLGKMGGPAVWTSTDPGCIRNDK
jgi:biofilm PGA synthesis N-glycosyltransferase PgaC